MNKKRVAKEWLYFLGALLVGLVVLSLVPFFTKGNYTFSVFLALVDKQEALLAWLIALGPYVLFQLLRSVIWAWKTARSS